MRWVVIMAATGILALGSESIGHAKAVFQEDFRAATARTNDGTVVKRGAGFAWKGLGRNSTVQGGGYRMYDIQGLNPEAGTVEMDVTRSESQETETLFSFGDENGHELFGLYVDWAAPTPDGGTYPPKIRTAIFPLFHQKEIGDFGLPYLHDGLYLGRRIGKGQTFHVAFTWGSRGPRVYLDGKLLDGEVARVDPIPGVISKTKKFLIGGRIGGPKHTDVWDTPSSLIANVQVHDTELRPSDLATPFSTGLTLSAVSNNAFKAAGFSGKLVAGNRLQVSLEGTPGGTGSFDLAHFPGVDGKIPLDWRGWGTYLEEKSSFAENEVDLADAVGYRVYASQTPFAAVSEEMVPVSSLKVQEQSYTLEFLEIDKPYYVAVVAEMRDGTLKPVIWPVQNVALAETAPGVYTGAYEITYGDRMPRGVVVGRLAKGGEVATLADVANAVTVDPALRIAVVASPNELKADEKSASQVTVSVTDANGDPVAGHKIRFLLATTSQYTGVVGGGAFADQVGGTMQESVFGETDLFGRLTATYVAGFAAKTAVIVARDMQSNDTGAGWVKTYIQAGAQLELLPVEPMATAGDGYEITVTTSNDWLTADGKSQARITAKVTLGGKPVEGHQVAFDLSGVGTIRVVKDVTDRNGEARAVYTAGKKIGIVLVTATDTTVGISGSVQIELRSDAPAKIKIKISPEKLPADGRSRADLLVQVSDINDNPNDNVEVEYAITSGAGRLKDEKGLTDRKGESTNEYTAGRSAGVVSFEITVRSTIPTEEELITARDMALAVPDYAFR